MGRAPPPVDAAEADVVAHHILWIVSEIETAYNQGFSYFNVIDDRVPWSIELSGSPDCGYHRRLPT
jgi:hypothetical protein